MADKEDPEVKQLKKIERKLDVISDRVGSTKLAFFTGILSGAGWIIGFIIAVVLVSYILSLLGVIPGLADIVGQIQSILQHWKSPQ